MHKLVDDIIVFGRTKKELLDRLEQVLVRCKENQITLSDSKQQLGQEVRFAGHIVSNHGYKPDPVKVQAIKDFPTPTNVTDVRSFMGLLTNLWTTYQI